MTQKTIPCTGVSRTISKERLGSPAGQRNAAMENAAQHGCIEGAGKMSRMRNQSAIVAEKASDNS